MTRWRALFGFLGLALAATAGLYAVGHHDSPGRVGPGRYRDGRGRLGRGGASPASSSAGFAFCDNLTAGMKSGSWSCVNGDISSPAASTLAFTGVNSPAATAGTSCAAPNYQTFVNGSTHSHVASTVASAVIAGDLTTCAVFTPSTAGATDTYVFLGVNATLSPFAFTQEGATAYWHGTNQQSLVINSPTQNVKSMVCIKWNASTKVGTYYVNSDSGSTEASAPAASGALDGTNQILRFGSDGTGASFAGKFFGGFLTNQIVSKATLDAFFAAAVTCS